MKLFYCKAQVHSLKSDGGVCQLFSHGDHVMVERAAETRILCADRQASSVGALLSGCFQRIAYAVYGTHDGAARSIGAIGFSGYYRDPITGHYVLGNGYRTYSANVMRFLSADALSPFDRGGINAYAYCEGNPVDRVDPEGRNWRGALELKSPSSIKLSGAKVQEVKKIAQPAAGGWETKVPRARLTSEFKKEFDETPSDDLGHVDFEEIRPWVALRSAKNARREFIRSASRGGEIRAEGILPGHLRKLRGDANVFQSIAGNLFSLRQGPDGPPVTNDAIRASSLMVKDAYNGFLDKHDSLIKSIRQERDEHSVDPSRY